MSFFHPTSTAARTRRPRENTTRSTGTNAGRRHKDSSKPREEKSTPSNSPPGRHSPIGPSAPCLEHTSDVPRSGAGSPTSATFPGTGPFGIGAPTSGIYQLPFQPVTPAALQQYLDIETDVDVCGHDVTLDAPSNLVQSVPDLNTMHNIVEHAKSEDEKSIKSEPAELPQEKTPHPRDPLPVKPVSPKSLSRTTSQAYHSEMMHERSFTPPPPPLVPAPSQSPPVYMSPIPVRAQTFGQQFLYQNNAVYSSGQSYAQPIENTQTTHVPYAYYPEQTTRYHHRTSDPMQRSHTQETSNSASRRSYRHSGNFSGPEDDVLMMVHRINAVLPDFHSLLDRYDEAAGHLFGESRSRRQSEHQWKEAIKDKESHIHKLRRDMDGAKAHFETEKSTLQLELSQAKASKQELEASLLARTRSREHLQEKISILEKSHEDVLSRSNQIDVALESFRQWTLKELAANSVPQETPKQDILASEGNKETYAAADTTEKTLPGHYTDSRGVSPAPPEITLPAPLDLQAEIEAAQVKEAQARAGWKTEVEASQQRERHLRESFQQERDMQKKQWDDERAELQRRWDERHRTLIEMHKREKDDLQRTMESAESRYAKRYSDLESENNQLRQQVERLRMQQTTDRSRWWKSATELKDAAVRADKESQHLRRILDTFGNTLPDESHEGARHITSAHAGMPGDYA